MSDKKTIAIFGAGPGLGASVAGRFGREGYQVALVARRAGPLDERVAELAGAGIEAAAFPADLNDVDGIGALVGSIKERFGSIDVAFYAPVPPDTDFVAAPQLTASKLQSLARIFLFSPVEVARALLPDFLKRGDGAFIVAGGLSAVRPTPGFSAHGPLMSAVRNYVLTLNAEVSAKGVYAGSVSIGGVIDRSAGKRDLDAKGIQLPPSVPIVDPDDIAQEIWTLVTERNRPEAIVPAMPTA